MNDKFEWVVPALVFWICTIGVALLAYMVYEVEQTKRLEIQACEVKK